MEWVVIGSLLLTLKRCWQFLQGGSAVRCLLEHILFLSHCSHEKNWRTLARSDGLWIAAEAATSGVWTAG